MAGGKRQLLKVVSVVVVFLLLFVYICYSIPQVDSQPPAETIFDVTKIKTKQDLAKIGQSIFFGKGKCALCHSIGDNSGRCPNLEIKGAQLTRDFIYESLTQPSKYIYMDYTASPPRPFPAHMPIINKPPVGLNDNELLAVIAFVQTLGGDITVDPSELSSPAVTVASGGNPEMGKKLFAEHCAKCHSLGGGAGKGKIIDLEPSVNKMNESAIRLAIFNSQVEKPGAAGQAHLHLDERLSVKGADDLVAYLMRAKGPDHKGDGEAANE
jgi:mono/diheme cytochrome c family protein